MTPTQRTLITELVAAELKKMTAAALASGVSRADVTAELDRRRKALRAG